MSDEPDQITFVMAVGEQRFYKTVSAGQTAEGQTAADVLQDIIHADSRWIAVDDSKWILRDGVLYACLARSNTGR